MASPYTSLAGPRKGAGGCPVDGRMTMNRSAPVALVGLDAEVAELLTDLGFHRMVGYFALAATTNPTSLQWLGGDAAWSDVAGRIPDLRLVMTLDSPDLKARLVADYGSKSFINICAATVQLSPTAEIGHGCVIQYGVKVGAGAKIGAICKLNADATVHHDGRVGDFCTLAPGARLLGGVTLGDRVFIGAGAIVLPHVQVGTGALIAAGAVVTSDVPSNGRVAGVPAKPLRSRKRIGPPTD